MNPRTKRKMNLLNNRLAEYGQETRVSELTAFKLVLNSGKVLEKNEASKFSKRVLNSKIDLWVKNIDNLLNGIVSESQIKRIFSSRGGRACQRKHKEKIIKNLNCGEPWNKGKTGLQESWAKGLTKDTDSRILKFAKFGEKNGMFGKKMSYEKKAEKSKKMKECILSGRFTPNSNNRNTHWEAQYLGKKYRSSWEAWYQYLTPTAEYETLRIPYKIDDKDKIFIVDFIDHKNRTVVEIKPEELTKSKIFLAKWDSLSKWAYKNNYEAIVVTKKWLIYNTFEIDYSYFDEKTSEKIRKIYETSKKN